MIEVKGKANIVARILADSINEQGNRLTTWEVEYPRIVHADLMTHRMFSRNAASSRAIPFNKMVEQLRGMPVRFGANQSGMQDKGKEHTATIEHFDDEYNRYEYSPAIAWEAAKTDACIWAEGFYEAGYHKQIFNRLVEPFQTMKTVISATETANFFWLRDDEAADPTIREIARCMKEAQDQSVPELLKAGEFHVPYIRILKRFDGKRCYALDDSDDPEILSAEEAVKVSCARCAAVSYRNEGYGLEKSLEVYDKLLGSDKKHASAFEHVATPMANRFGELFVNDVNRWVNHSNSPLTWEKGISHVDREGNLWSGNFKSWIQFRKTIDGENYEAKAE